MIPLLLFFLTINFQSDFKGFSSKDEALYYSELLKCEGYFTKNDNDKIFYFPCSSESELQNAYQEIEVEPTVTEIWDPEPDVICLLYTSPSPRDKSSSRMPSSA